MKALMDLAVDTLSEPKETAQRIMALQLPRREIYLALVAVAALNAVLAGLPVTLGPPPDPELVQQVPLLALMQRPFALFFLIAGGLVVMAHGLYWAGRSMGGTGALDEMLVLLTWLQALRAAAQLIILVTSLALPGIGGLLALAVAIVGFWLLLHFISAAMRFDSLLRAFGLLVAVFAGLLLGLMLMVTLLGLSAGGVSNV